MGLTFTQIDRSLIKMLFVRETVAEIRNTIMHNGKTYDWVIVKREKNGFHDEQYYDVAFGRDYRWHRCDSLDEAMDKLENLARKVTE